MSIRVQIPEVIDGEATAAILMNAALKKAEEDILQQGGNAEDVIRCALFSLSFLAVRIATNQFMAEKIVFSPEHLFITPKVFVDYQLEKLESQKN